jgi:hypothetical protein
MTSVEPAPVSLPELSTLALRLYHRLPAVYRTLDARNGYALLRYVGAACAFAGELDDMIESLRGSRPIGPATPEPWDLCGDELARWRAGRTSTLSLLADPNAAPMEWLPYVAQLVGARLHPQAGVQERRDTIADATSGYRAGSRAALADAARSALTGSRYVLVQPFMRGDGTAGTMWDITIRTRVSETPSQQAVIDTVVRKGAKPAGARLWYATFGTSWDKIEALFPTWSDWERHTWDQIEEAGATFADVSDNLAPGASFETAADIAKWVGAAQGGGSAPTWALDAGVSIDGANAGRLSKVGATGGMAVKTAAAINDARILPGREFLFSVSAKPSVALAGATLQVDWQNSSGAAISSTSVAVGALAAGDWNRGVLTTRHTSPAGAARAALNVIYTGAIAAGVVVDVDAALFRIVSAAGG